MTCTTWRQTDISLLRTGLKPDHDSLAEPSLGLRRDVLGGAACVALSLPSVSP